VIQPSPSLIDVLACEHAIVTRRVATGRIARGQGRLLAALAVCLLSVGCAARSAPRTAGAAETASRPRPFVPAFAYEAYIRGELALAQGKPREAAQQLEMATAAPDEDAYLLSRLAEAQRQSGEAALALQTLAEAERVEPCSESLWLTRGGWAERDRDLQTAARAYAQAVACAPGSDRGVLALARVWSESGEQARALELLANSARLPSLAGAKAAFARALGTADVAEVRFALDTWLSLAALDTATYRSALSRALQRDEPTLALSLSELSATPIDGLLKAQLLSVTHARAALRALLAQHQEGELGGPDSAAQLSLSARDFERAELYASLSIGRQPSDLGFATRALARRGLGQHEAALEDIRAVGNHEQKRALARSQLAALGLAALASELAALPQAAQ
jgi:tetratricopeptide (TPR) repeat protein